MSFYWQQFPEFGACALAVLVGTLKISSCAVGNVAVRSAKQKKSRVRGNPSQSLARNECKAV
jgi:hypothetical protein